MTSDALRIYMFNVGSGDHLMVEFPDSSIGIIDSFFTDHKLNLQEPPAVTFLKYRINEKKRDPNGCKIKIAFLCLSHADHDHIKGVNVLFKLLEENADHLELENMWLFGGVDFDLYKEEIGRLNTEFGKLLSEDAREEFDRSARRFNNELVAIQEFKRKWSSSGVTESYFDDFKEFIKYNPDRPYKAYSLGPIARIINKQQEEGIGKLIASIYERVQSFQNNITFDGDVKLNLSFNRNSASAILGIYAFGYGFLFFGDATCQTIEASFDDITKKTKNAIELFFNPHFVKVGHHGATGSTSIQMWDKLFNRDSGMAIFGVSAGGHKKFKHPNIELFEHINDCCGRRGIKHRIFRTNECISCNSKPAINGELDLDFWFELHGCTIDDERLVEAINLDSPQMNNSISSTDNKNLLAYVFEFSKDDVKVFRGVSKLVGSYNECVFGQKRECYCGGQP